MSKLKLSIAVGDYDRIRPLVDGTVQIDGVDPVFMLLEPEEIFFRAFRHADFDICELSMSSFSVKTANGDCPYVGVPVFPSRAFRHNSIYIRTDRGIVQPEDLKGKRIGVPEYQVTANVWTRAVLEDEHGVKPSDVTWIRGGYDHPGRIEKIALNLPSDVRVEDAPEGATISGMLANGEIDAIIGPRAPSCFSNGHPQVAWLYPDPAAAAAAWFRKTRIFPIMHILGVRRTLAEQHPWLPAAAMKAFEQSKFRALEQLAQVAASKVTLPFLDEQLHAARKLMGEDYWSYGLAANRHVLEVFLRRHYAEGLSSRLLLPEELFHPSTHETFRVNGILNSPRQIVSRAAPCVRSASGTTARPGSSRPVSATIKLPAPTRPTERNRARAPATRSCPYGGSRNTMSARGPAVTVRASTGSTSQRSPARQASIFARNTVKAGLARSTNTACAAPRDNASRPRAPVPAKTSSTEASAITGASAHGACINMSNNAWRTRSAVGLVAVPDGACNERPRHSPAMMRIQRGRFAGLSGVPGFGSCSRSTRVGTSSMPPRGNVPNWNGP